jgi:alternate signal-mediated exported protein
MSAKKKIAAIVAVILTIALLVGGVFAYTDFSQDFINRFRGGNDNDILLHDDFEPGVNKDVYVENTGETEMIVRVKFTEYLQIGNTPIVGTDPNDKATWELHLFGETSPATENCTLETHDYFTWVMSGGTKVYKPGTGEAGNDSFTVGQDFEDGAIAKTTLPANVPISMAEYMANRETYDAEVNGRWILDTDGYAYWSKLLQPHTATNLLLDNVITAVKPDDNYYYAIDVILEGANKTEAYKLIDKGATDDGEDLIDGLDGDDTPPPALLNVMPQIKTLGAVRHESFSYMPGVMALIQGNLYSWGGNAYGILAQDSADTMRTLSKVSFPKETTIVSYDAGFAVGSEGELWSWSTLLPEMLDKLYIMSEDCHYFFESLMSYEDTYITQKIDISFMLPAGAKAAQVFSGVIYFTQNYQPVVLDAEGNAYTLYMNWDVYDKLYEANGDYVVDITSAADFQDFFEQVCTTSAVIGGKEQPLLEMRKVNGITGISKIDTTTGYAIKADGTVWEFDGSGMDGEAVTAKQVAGLSNVADISRDDYLHYKDFVLLKDGTLAVRGASGAVAIPFAQGIKFKAISGCLALAENGDLYMVLYELYGEMDQTENELILLETDVAVLDGYAGLWAVLGAMRRSGYAFVCAKTDGSMRSIGSRGDYDWDMYSGYLADLLFDDWFVDCFGPVHVEDYTEDFGFGNGEKWLTYYGIDWRDVYSYHDALAERFFTEHETEWNSLLSTYYFVRPIYSNASSYAQNVVCAGDYAEYTSRFAAAFGAINSYFESNQYNWFAQGLTMEQVINLIVEWLDANWSTMTAPAGYDDDTPLSLEDYQIIRSRILIEADGLLSKPFQLHLREHVEDLIADFSLYRYSGYYELNLPLFAYTILVYDWGFYEPEYLTECFITMILQAIPNLPLNNGLQPMLAVALQQAAQ